MIEVGEFWVIVDTWGIARQFPRGSFKLHVISHRANWTRHLSWNYLVLQRLPSPVPR